MLPEESHRNTENPRVSIVMSFYKEPLQWISCAVESIQKQSFTDFELLTVCDNPDYIPAIDLIREKARKDPRIRLIENDRNLGQTISLNIGIAASRGEYIARMDSDDISHEDRLLKQTAFLDSRKDVSICACDAHIINANGKVIRKNRYKRKNVPIDMFISNCIAHPAVMFRRSLIELRSPLYDEEYRYSQDYELWSCMLLKGQKIHMLPDALLLYRKSPSQISARHRHEQDSFFRKAHRRMIAGWLAGKGFISHGEDDPAKLLSICSTAYRHADAESRECLDRIIYVLYYSLGSHNWRHRLRYLTDRNMIMFRVRPIMTLRLLFTKARRRSRISII